MDLQCLGLQGVVLFQAAENDVFHLFVVFLLQVFLNMCGIHSPQNKQPWLLN